MMDQAPPRFSARTAVEGPKLGRSRGRVKTQDEKKLTQF